MNLKDGSWIRWGLKGVLDGLVGAKIQSDEGNSITFEDDFPAMKLMNHLRNARKPFVNMSRKDFVEQIRFCMQEGDFQSCFRFSTNKKEKYQHLTVDATSRLWVEGQMTEYMVSHVGDVSFGEKDSICIEMKDATQFIFDWHTEEIEIRQENAMPQDGDNDTYVPTPIDTSYIELPEEILAIGERLAENTHETWAAQRIADGWRYGPQRDDQKKLHPCLVPYDELPDEEKEYDRKTAMETLKLITALGFKVYMPMDGKW